MAAAMKQIKAFSAGNKQCVAGCPVRVVSLATSSTPEQQTAYVSSRRILQQQWMQLHG
jgi:Na+-translocating ferredoxin:NAD+ oxidoreductase RNF subunit RnfB